MSLTANFTATSLILTLNKRLGEIAAQILFGENAFHFGDPSDDDLPLFLSNLRATTFQIIRKVRLSWVGGSYARDLTHGIDLLSGCKPLRSLEINNSRRITKKYHPIPKRFRLESFKCSETTGLDDVTKIIRSEKGRTPHEEKQVQLTRKEKVRFRSSED
jgi:hypothetical protein